MSPYKVLGVSETASEDELLKAYRKLRQQHHPDKGGDAAEFIKVNEAWDKIQNMKKAKRSTSHFTNFTNFSNGRTTNNQYDFAEILKNIREAEKYSNFRSEQVKREAVLTTTMEQAFKGGTMELQLDDMVVKINVRAGLLDSVYFTEYVDTRVGTMQVDILTNITSSKFKWLRDSSGACLSGDLQCTHEVSAALLMTGGFIEVQDVEGKTFQVRVPVSSKAPRLKLSGRGYYSARGGRGDLYISIEPNFKIESFSKDEILQLQARLSEELQLRDSANGSA